MSGAITLGALQHRLSVLAVSCTKCGRKGRYRLAGLVERHGTDMKLPDFAAHLSADCPKRGNLVTDQCQVHFPDLGIGKIKERAMKNKTLKKQDPT